MADGLNTTLANSILNNLTGNTTWTANTSLTASLAIGSPGANGTSNPSAGSAVKQTLTYNAAASGSITLTTTPTAWTNASGTETLTDVAYWNQVPTFQWSAPMNSSHTWNINDTFTLTSATVTITPLAA